MTILLEPVLEDEDTLDPENKNALIEANESKLLGVCEKGYASLNKMVNKPLSQFISKTDLQPKAVSLQIDSLMDKNDMGSCHSFQNRQRTCNI